jgi:hypothetical protein
MNRAPPIDKTDEVMASTPGTPSSVPDVVFGRYCKEVFNYRFPWEGADWTINKKLLTGHIGNAIMLDNRISQIASVRTGAVSELLTMIYNDETFNVCRIPADILYRKILPFIQQVAANGPKLFKEWREDYPATGQKVDVWDPSRTLASSNCWSTARDRPARMVLVTEEQTLCIVALMFFGVIPGIYSVRMESGVNGGAFTLQCLFNYFLVMYTTITSAPAAEHAGASRAIALNYGTFAVKQSAPIIPPALDPPSDNAGAKISTLVLSSCIPPPQLYMHPELLIIYFFGIPYSVLGARCISICTNFGSTMKMASLNSVEPASKHMKFDSYIQGIAADGKASPDRRVNLVPRATVLICSPDMSTNIDEVIRSYTSLPAGRPQDIVSVNRISSDQYVIMNDFFEQIIAASLAGKRLNYGHLNMAWADTFREFVIVLRRRGPITVREFIAVYNSTMAQGNPNVLGVMMSKLED